jgi:hypothetical protein
LESVTARVNLGVFGDFRALAQQPMFRERPPVTFWGSKFTR